MRFSVVTCLYRPDQKTFVRVLESVERQSLSRDQWEYIVVDNELAPGERPWLDLRWHPNGKVVAETQPGLAHARRRGLIESRGDNVVFVDQDNVLDPNYLERAATLLAAHPLLGVLGGFSEAEFERAPPRWMHEFLPILGAMQYRDDPRQDLTYACIKSAGPWVPAGSGMIVRRQVADEYLRQVQEDPGKLGIGRVNDRLLGSEDVDLAYTAIDMSMAIGQAQSLHFLHLIPAVRIDERYLIRLLYASNYATASLLIRRGWKNVAPLPPPSVKTRLRKIFTSLVPRTPAERCWAAFNQGYRDGLAQKPFDSAYR